MHKYFIKTIIISILYFTFVFSVNAYAQTHTCGSYSYTAQQNYTEKDNPYHSIHYKCVEEKIFVKTESYCGGTSCTCTTTIYDQSRNTIVLPTDACNVKIFSKTKFLIIDSRDFEFIDGVWQAGSTYFPLYICKEHDYFVDCTATQSNLLQKIAQDQLKILQNTTLKSNSQKYKSAMVMLFLIYSYYPKLISDDKFKPYKANFISKWFLPIKEEIQMRLKKRIDKIMKMND